MNQSIQQSNAAGCRTLPFIVEDKPYTTDKQFLTGAEIKKIAGLPKDSQLYLIISSPWKDEHIADDEQVDMAREGVEGFYIRKKLKFTLDCKGYETENQFITGIELRQLGKIPPDYQIFLAIKGGFEDELIKDHERVNLARPGIENFYSCKPNTTNG